MVRRYGVSYGREHLRNRRLILTGGGSFDGPFPIPPGRPTFSSLKYLLTLFAFGFPISHAGDSRSRALTVHAVYPPPGHWRLAPWALGVAPGLIRTARAR